MIDYFESFSKFDCKSYGVKSEHSTTNHDLKPSQSQPESKSWQPPKRLFPGQPTVTIFCFHILEAKVFIHETTI